MLIPSIRRVDGAVQPSLSRRVNANSQHTTHGVEPLGKLIKKGEC